MRKSVIVGFLLQATGIPELQGSSKQLMCGRKFQCLLLMYGDMADLLCERISTASYKIHEQVRRSC